MQRIRPSCAAYPQVAHGVLTPKFSSPRQSNIRASPAADDHAGWVQPLTPGGARNEDRWSAACKHKGLFLEVPEQSDREGSSKYQVGNECDARIQTSQECRDHGFRHRVDTSHSQGSVRSLRARGQGHRCARNLKHCPVKSIRHPHLHQTSRPH
jgi:hypothetical protein